MPPAEGHAADLSRNQASATAIHHSPGHSSLTGASPCHSNTLRLHCSQENIRHLGLKSKAPCGMVPACLASPNSQHPNAHCELSFPCTLPYALFPEHILLSLTSVPLLILFPLPECHSLPSLPFGELSSPDSNGISLGKTSSASPWGTDLSSAPCLFSCPLSSSVSLALGGLSARQPPC